MGITQVAPFPAPSYLLLLSFQCSFSCHPSISFSCHSSALFLSSQCLTLGSSFHKMVYFNITFILTNLIKFPDSSVTRWNDTLVVGLNYNVRADVCRMLRWQWCQASRRYFLISSSFFFCFCFSNFRVGFWCFIFNMII